MLFNSFEFLFFFAAVFPFYWLLKHRAQNYFLVIGSAVFYACWSWKFLFLMYFSISIDYWVSRFIAANPNQGSRRIALFISISVNVLILGIFKYYNFFIENLSLLLNFFHVSNSFVDKSLHLILPLGISFYTFEAISYVVDVYKGRAKPAQSYVDYILFVTFFPHLIAGPIMRAREFLVQIVNPRRFNANQFYEGCHLFFWGLFEKVYIADNLAKLVDPVFSQGQPYDGERVLLSLYAFAFQIFCDFDGYSNMARGLAKCLGFELTINFNIPYAAKNPKEFWQRWHISLSSWLKDYVYIPLGGNRIKGWATTKNLFLTMLIGGFWHGASWTFILWGGFHGLLLIAYRTNAWFHARVNALGGSLDWLKRIFFFHLIVLGWLFFRAENIPQVQQMLNALFFNWGAGGLTGSLWIEFLSRVTLLILIQWGQYRTGDLMYLYRMAWAPKIFLYALMTYLMVSWGAQGIQFLYFQF